MRVFAFCIRPDWAVGLVLLASVPLLASCSESRTSSGSGAQVGVAPADSMMELDLTEDPVVVQAQAEVLVSELNELRVVTNASKSFVTRTLAQPTLDLQAKAVIVLETSIKVDPKYKATAREILKKQHDVALPEDKIFWEDEIRRIFGPTAGSAGSGSSRAR